MLNGAADVLQGFPARWESEERVLTAKAAARGAGKERMSDPSMSQFSSVQQMVHETFLYVRRGAQPQAIGPAVIPAGVVSVLVFCLSPQPIKGLH